MPDKNAKVKGFRCGSSRTVGYRSQPVDTGGAGCDLRGRAWRWPAQAVIRFL